MGAPVLVLIGCSSRKLDRPAPARDFYQGTLFKAAVAWAGSCLLSWRVVSTKYGILLPDDTVEPYNETFSAYARGEAGYTKRTDAWGFMVKGQLSSYKGWRFLSIMGGEYEKDFPVPLWKPFKKLRLGPRIQWLRNNTGLIPEFTN